ncbi:hypothetical protein FB550_1181 [Neobacillus bataviensis]|uniref:Uncharacterized protein n=1 Tax=Neobacillus bataviensis TaxID=220685 RepID=A0A561CMA6_9BACI|nr:hypothetical protein FB550_1181 [Neobacillus bataviensis]
MTGVTINQRTVTLPVGNTYKIVVTAKYSDGSSKDFTNSAVVIFDNSTKNTDILITYRERALSGSTLILSFRVQLTVKVGLKIVLIIELEDLVGQSSI